MDGVRFVYFLVFVSGEDLPGKGVGLSECCLRCNRLGEINMKKEDMG